MPIDLIDRPWRRRLVGAAGNHDPSKTYWESMRPLLDRVWAALRGNGVANRGINHPVYDADGALFAGVEADVQTPEAIGLVVRELDVPRHAYYKHVGPYGQLGQAHAAVRGEITRRGLRHVPPLIEVYGHWTDDESKLEAELRYALEP